MRCRYQDWWNWFVPFHGRDLSRTSSAARMERAGFAIAEDGTWTLGELDAKQVARMLKVWPRYIRTLKGQIGDSEFKLLKKVCRTLSPCYLTPYSRATVDGMVFYATNARDKRRNRQEKLNWCVLRNDNGEDGLRVAKILRFYTHLDYNNSAKLLVHVKVYLSIEEGGDKPVMDEALGAPIFRERDHLYLYNQALAMYPIEYICPVRVSVMNHPSLTSWRVVLCRQMQDLFEEAGVRWC